MLANLGQRVDHRRLGSGGFDVHVDDVLPDAAGTRPRLELRQIQVALREGPKAPVQTPRSVTDTKNQRRLVGVPQRRRMSSESAEASVVVRISLYAFGQHLEAVELGRPFGGNSSRLVELFVDDEFGRTGSVIFGSNRKPQCAQELLTLGDRLWMRDHLLEIVDHRP